MTKDETLNAVTLNSMACTIRLIWRFTDTTLLQIASMTATSVLRTEAPSLPGYCCRKEVPQDVTNLLVSSSIALYSITSSKWENR